jgi:hypothetical protein
MRSVLARAAAIGMAHTGTPFVGTENVLRALVDDQDGIAASVLRELGVADRIAMRLDEIMSSRTYRTPSRKLNFAPPNK